MYSFEGDFRRKPQQNLAGASSSQKSNREALLQKAQHERLKREEHRRRLSGSIKIQAYIRSFLTRIRCKQLEREDFDAIVRDGQPNSGARLALLVRKLLFFHDKYKDTHRLIIISQHMLKHWISMVHEGGNFLQIRRLLLIHLKLLNDHTAQESLTVPLRMLEVFTSVSSINKILSLEDSVKVASDILHFLISKGFFTELRKVLELKTPPLIGSSAHPPTPVCESLFNIIIRPLNYIDQVDSAHYSKMVITEFVISFLSPELTDAVELFVLPHLVAKQNFPFVQMLDCIWDSLDKNRVQNSSWLLYSVLLLEPLDFVTKVHSKTPFSSNMLDNQYILMYLSILARLTSNLCNKAIEYTHQDTLSSHPIIDEDSDSETEHSLSCRREDHVLGLVTAMLNDKERCIGVVCAGASEEDWNFTSIQAISSIAHNLLLSHRMALHKYRLLYTLAFTPGFLRRLWNWLSRLEAPPNVPLLSLLSRGLAPWDVEHVLSPPLAVFCELFALLLATLHDIELRESRKDDSDNNITHGIQPNTAFTFTLLGPLSAALRQVCLGLVELAFPETRPSFTTQSNYNSNPADQLHEAEKAKRQTAVWAHLFKVCVNLLRQLHARDLRLHFLGSYAWTAPGMSAAAELAVGGAMPRPQRSITRISRLRPFRFYQPHIVDRTHFRDDMEDGPPLTTKEIRTMTILKEIPFVVPFSTRVLILQNLINNDKQEQQGDLTNFLPEPSIQIMIRRSHIYEDALDKLSIENEPNLRLKIRVQLVNVAGAEEAGVDGGGLTREFLSDILKAATDPHRGLFRLASDNTLYPNPAVHLLYENYPRHYFFIGRMLGKILYENLLVELPFAEFFLNKLLSSSAGEVDVHGLASLDPTLYRGLLQLKAHNKEDVQDLGLDFTVVSDEFGEQKIEELKPGGSNIAVTAENRIEYIHLMADYKLNKQIRLQCAAFKKGLTSVVERQWLGMFSHRELQLLISGADTPLDVEDLMRNTNYSGGYSPEHPTIQSFWKVVSNFTDEEKKQLLKFVTSYSRPPLLGFKDLDPPFCIQNAGTAERLPSASTCINLLKLPEFHEERLLRDKLLYAIQSGAGFELS